MSNNSPPLSPIKVFEGFATKIHEQSDFMFDHKRNSIYPKTTTQGDGKHFDLANKTLSKLILNKKDAD